MPAPSILMAAGAAKVVLPETLLAETVVAETVVAQAAAATDVWRHPRARASACTPVTICDSLRLA